VGAITLPLKLRLIYSFVSFSTHLKTSLNSPSLLDTKVMLILWRSRTFSTPSVWLNLKQFAKIELLGLS